MGKKVSEVNELIKGKRNITIQRDILLATVFDDEPKKWIGLQMEYDYQTSSQSVDQQKIEDIKVRKNSIAAPSDLKLEPSEEIVPIPVATEEQSPTISATESPVMPVSEEDPEAKHDHDKKHAIFRDF
ncbi:MAG: hypothetical protein WCG98_08765 [bacterium]